MTALRAALVWFNVVMLLGCAQIGSQSEMQFAEDSPPNIIIVLTDDQGYGDLGFNHNPNIHTPTLDQFFNQGITFDRFYVSPVCAPTRASLLTGKHSLATGVFHVTRGGEKMHREQSTLAEYLKPAGYRSGLFGKWHNGLQYPHSPLGQGFDEFYGFAEGHKTLYFDDFVTQNKQKVPFKGYIADRLTDKAIDFIRANQQQPFFTFLAFNTPHSPFEVPSEYFHKYKAAGLSDLDASVYGMVENIDDNMQRVLMTLDELQLRDNTIVIYLSDNGPAFPGGHARFNGNLKGHKGQVDEGGVRSPLSIQWPAQLTASKRISNIAQHIDVVPTLLSLAGIEFDSTQFDGKDVSPLLKGSQAENQWPERLLFTHKFRNDKGDDNSYIQKGPGAVRSQKWLATLGYGNSWELYDIENDPQQQQDLALVNPQQLQRLSSAYENWFAKVTEEHGPYNTLPIEIGHPSFDEVLLPSHEAIIDQQTLAYAFKDGWSHDWLVSQSVQQGQAHWPIKVVEAGRYRVSLAYATPETTYAGPVIIATSSQTIENVDIAPFQPQTISHQRHYYTNEAPEMIWGKLVLGEVTLSPSNTLLSISFANDINNHPLWVKHIELVKVD